MAKVKCVYPEAEPTGMMVEEPVALFSYSVNSRQAIIGEIKRGLPVQSFDACASSSVYRSLSWPKR